MRIVITGADGFIARNLRVRLSELGTHEIVPVTRTTPPAEFEAALTSADFVFHLAGVNRPRDPSEFDSGNAGLTGRICGALRDAGRAVPVAISSSTQAALDNPYGRSKRAAEEIVEAYAQATGAPVYVFRFPNVFGKWARPNYNSAVATFCHNLSRGLPIDVHDPAAPLNLLYVDDAVTALLALLGPNAPEPGAVAAAPVYETTVGEVADTLREIAAARTTHVVPHVGVGLTRALQATYLSYLPPADFAYALTRHADPRGVFVELLKTKESGQFSYFTAQPGVTRGQHYHHTKNEKFFVVAGRARFGFRHVVTGELHEIVVEGEESRVVETVPGWVHDITNVGTTELVVLLWANEVFDREAPDTIPAKVHPVIETST